MENSAIIEKLKKLLRMSGSSKASTQIISGHL